MKFSYGIMQGRLSKKIGNKIQAFPEKNWKSEFNIARRLGIKKIEWTLDYKNFKKNPLLTKKGRAEINKLSKQNFIKIKTLTGDCFMQKPFWKTKNKDLINELIFVIECSGKVGIKYIVVPLVDNGSIENIYQQRKLIEICSKIKGTLKKNKIKLIFESDFGPIRLQNFIKKFDKKYFGINYDTGNSACLGHDINKEFNCYGKYICNIHIKDRVRWGKTVRLGYGRANFRDLYANLKKIKYKGSLILQTARSKNNNEIKEIKVNLDYLKKASL